MHIRLNAILFVVVLTAGAPLATSAEPGARQWLKVAATLEADQSPASLSTAALIHLSQQDKPKALALIDGAAALAPTDPSIAWLSLNICGMSDDCNPTDRAARLLDLDGGNAAVHYPALVRARRNKDAAAEDQALAAMASSGYFDVYWSRLTVRAADTLAAPRGRKGTPLRGVQWATSDAVGWLAYAAIPPFSATSDSCKGERLSRDDVKDWCQKLVEVMENGDTFIAQAIGQGIGSRVFDSTDRRFDLVEERKRQGRYLRDAVAPHVENSMSTPGKANSWLDRFRVHRREADVYRAWLVELGLPPDAPTGYELKPPK